MTAVRPPAPATTRVRHRANPLFLLPGVLLAMTGVVLMVAGFIYAATAILNRGPTLSDLGVSPNARDDMAPIVNGFTVVIVGCTVLTVGRYLWRGARRRGWRDRIGRLLAIVGYLDIGMALFVLTRFISAAFGAADTDSEGAFTRGLVVSLALAVPGVALALTGLRMAKEEVLMTAEVNASP